jgi:hypothetical protein
MRVSLPGFVGERRQSLNRNPTRKRGTQDN